MSRTVSLADFNHPPMIRHSLRMLLQRVINFCELKINGNLMGICWDQCAFVAFHSFSKSKESRQDSRSLVLEIYSPSDLFVTQRLCLPQTDVIGPDRKFDEWKLSEQGHADFRAVARW